MAVSYGHVAIVPKGIWSAETQYEACNLVEHDGSSYVAKARPPIGTLPTDTAYWQVSAAGTKKATVDSLGTVMPDGTTTEVNEEGKISAKTAQQDSAGMVKGSDDITVGEDGALTINTAFEQATELANLIAGEAIKEVLGKVSKAIATTMNLDQNALLKNMVSGIDANDGNKIPSSAFVHTLYERLGMGTDLSAGDATNVTQAVNSLYSNMNALTDSSISIPSGSPVTGNRASAKIYQNSFLVLSGEVSIDFTNLKNWTGYNILQCSSGSKYTINFIATDENGGSYHMQIETNGIIKLSIRGYLPENKSQILRFFCIAPLMSA